MSAGMKIYDFEPVKNFVHTDNKMHIFV